MRLEHLSRWEVGIVRIGVFVMFIVTFGDYIVRKLWAILGPLFG
jgi:hypothetical protein